MQNWHNDLADRLVDLILYAHGGKRPEREADWHSVAERFGVDFSIHWGSSRRRGLLLDDVIVVRGSGDPEKVNRRAAHEFSEYLLQSEWDCPFIVPASDLERERHLISRLIENRF